VFALVPGKQGSLVPAGWSIGVEMLFYLVFPLLYWGLPRLRAKLLLLLAVALSAAALVRLVPAFVAPITLLPVFLAGVAAFDLWQRLRGRSWWLGLLFFAVAAAVFCCQHQMVLPRLNTLFHCVGFAMLLLGTAMLPLRLLVNRVSSFYGEISYSVYLWHLPVMSAMVPAYRELLALLGPGVPLFCAALALVLVVLTGVSWLSFRFIESPGIALGKHLLAAVIARRGLARAGS